MSHDPIFGANSIFGDDFLNFNKMESMMNRMIEMRKHTNDIGYDLSDIFKPFGTIK